MLLQPCNPAVGGPAKSQLVHEVDALGGEIGKMADRSYVQKRVLNRSKGPAVWALRAQTDKHEYAQLMRSTLEQQANLEIREGMVVDVQVRGWLVGVTGGSWCGKVDAAAGLLAACKCSNGNLQEQHPWPHTVQTPT